MLTAMGRFHENNEEKIKLIIRSTFAVKSSMPGLLDIE